MTERLTPEALRSRLRAAIGEPVITRGGFDLTAARARRRWWRWLDLGQAVAMPAPLRVVGVVVLAVTLASALTVATLVQLRGLPNPAGSSGPAGPSPSVSSSASVSSVSGFVPRDVTAVSATQWWVLGADSTGCSGAVGCTRILHTLDGGTSFTSIPVPPAAVTGLRFRNPEYGWAYGGTTVWSTHDGGAEWSPAVFAGATIRDLETSGSYVWAVACTATLCSLERSSTTEDGWGSLALPGDVATSGLVPGSLNVHGGEVVMAFSWRAAGGGESVSRVLTSTDAGDRFSETTSLCPGPSGIVSLNAANADDLWATCSTGSTVGVYRSQDGGTTFAPVPETGSANGEPSWGTIAGGSASSVVLAGTRLLVSSDGGETFQLALDNGDDWSIVGFTTPQDGFALSLPPGKLGPPTGLWRTDDAGAQWYEVAFP